ncbi:hypothetical protein [Longicatena caecimuris]|uniref:hypothetical protein n=1 Tax=Longicatena caecimuris TaxID=1796635 RepID=UPI0018A9517E|nr:hypothetical protein [Longicatena caecimuris]
MLKELADKIEELVNGQVKPEILEHEGVDYVQTARGFEPLRKPSTKAIEVNSLEGLVKMIKNALKDAELDGMYGIYKPFIVNIKFNEIYVMSALCEDKSRNYLVESYPITPTLKIDYDISVEEMIILLSTSFVQTENTQKFIESLSSLRIVEEVEFNDDGIGQTVTAKKGTSMNQKYQIQPIVKLKPIRTYAEIEQVESKFLFRVNKDGTVCLREADGGQWKYETQKRIAAYLEEHLKEEIEANDVVVIG